MKLFIIFVLVAVAYSAPSGFSYEVGDPNTNDYKSHSESRVGDVVHGHYSVQEPDGSNRIINYIADEEGFKAVVRKCPPGWGRLMSGVPVGMSGSYPAPVRAPTVAPGLYDPSRYSAQPEITAWPYGSYLN